MRTNGEYSDADHLQVLVDKYGDIIFDVYRVMGFPKSLVKLEHEYKRAYVQTWYNFAEAWQNSRLPRYIHS